MQGLNKCPHKKEQHIVYYIHFVNWLITTILWQQLAEYTIFCCFLNAMWSPYITCKLNKLISICCFATGYSC